LLRKLGRVDTLRDLPLVARRPQQQQLTRDSLSAAMEAALLPCGTLDDRKMDQPPDADAAPASVQPTDAPSTDAPDVEMAEAAESLPPAEPPQPPAEEAPPADEMPSTSQGADEAPPADKVITTTLQVITTTEPPGPSAVQPPSSPPSSPPPIPLTRVSLRDAAGGAVALADLTAVECRLFLHGQRVPSGEAVVSDAVVRWCVDYNAADPPQLIVHTLTARYVLGAAEHACDESYAALWLPLVRSVRLTAAVVAAARARESDVWAAVGAHLSPAEQLAEWPFVREQCAHLT
jgi:hypothetical protein